MCGGVRRSEGEMRERERERKRKRLYNSSEETRERGKYVIRFIDRPTPPLGQEINTNLR